MTTKSRIFLPRVIVPYRWIQLQESSVHKYDPPWFFFWEPYTPCNMCDSGQLFKLSPNIDTTPNVHIKWVYIELLADAELLKKPHGLSFEKGSIEIIPNYVRRVLFNFLTKEKNYTVLTEFQYLKWVRNKWIQYYPKNMEDIKRGQSGYTRDKRVRREYRTKNGAERAKKIREGLIRRKQEIKRRRIYGTED